MNPSDTLWVENTLASLSLEQRIAQLFILPIGNDSMHSHVLDILENIPIGGAFLGGCDARLARSRIEQLQAKSALPLVVAGDLECGAGPFKGLTRLPSPLALSATRSEELAYQYGKATAVEGRSIGIHWTFAPVVDVNIHPDNPITCTRSLGDDPAHIARMATAVIRGMQDHGLAACPKHFPGDGTDDVDQHITTPVNNFSRSEWFEISGRTFRESYAAGAWSTMIGHIALPAWDNSRNPAGLFCPATLSKAIVTGLLRDELGFDGLAVTDDMGMGGVGGYLPRNQRVAGAIAAGCDMFLFPDLPRDYHILLDAVNAGLIGKERIEQACRRVLTLKARLKLHEGMFFTPAPGTEQSEEFRELNHTVAARSLSLVRDVAGQLPLKLRQGARVLTATLGFGDGTLDHIDRLLRDRGFFVEHIDNPENGADFADHAAHFDAVFVNFMYRPTWAVGTVRPIGPQNRIFFKGLITDHPGVIYTSFGSPYLLRSLRGLPNYLNVYSDCESSQKAAVAAWFGEADTRAQSPVGNLTVL